MPANLYMDDNQDEQYLQIEDRRRNQAHLRNSSSDREGLDAGFDAYATATQTFHNEQTKSPNRSQPLQAHNERTENAR